MNEEQPARPERAPTAEAAYARRLLSLGGKRWKQLLDVQRPYRWNLGRTVQGRVLEVGCGVGRNLQHLADTAVGVDHNAEAIAVCRANGLTAYLPDEFRTQVARSPQVFDTLLLAHVIEHMHQREAEALLAEYLPFLRPGGLLLLICPQEAGFASDDTHVQFFDVTDLELLSRTVGAVPVHRSSFPFPRPVGRLFRYNESVVVARTRD